MKLPDFKQKTTQLVSSLILVMIFGVILGLAWAYISDSYIGSPLKKGHFSFGQTYTGEDLASSLDLRVAAKAAYQSSALAQTQDLGEISGTHQSVVSFSVPQDGITEYGLMSVPLSKMPAGGYPAIILCHGYYNPAQYSTTKGYLNDMEFYSQHGFVVVKPDYRGQGFSAQVGRPEGAYYSMAYNSDIMSLIASLKQTNYINKHSINLWGQSMGAYIALRATVLSPDIRHTILLSGPVGQIQDMYKMYVAPSDKDNPVAYQIKQGAIAKYGSPVANPNYWENASPINFVNSTSAYIEINVGTADKVVPPVFSKQLDSALTKAGKAHQYFVYQGGGHGLQAERPQIWQRSLQVLEN